jgi:hypothetical protein
MSPQSYAHVVSDTGSKHIQWRKESLLIKCCWRKWLCDLQKIESRFMFITLYWCQLKQIKDLNIRPKTLNLVQERAGFTLKLIGIRLPSIELQKLSN